jgi:uncharacterized membrane protein (DUF485 family)
MSTNDYVAIRSNPKFGQLVEARTRFGWILAIIMLALYFGFVLIVAFAPGLFAVRIGSGVTTIGIPVGLAVILAAFVLAGVYVRRANSEFDDLTKQIVREAE